MFSICSCDLPAPDCYYSLCTGSSVHRSYKPVHLFNSTSNVGWFPFVSSVFLWLHTFMMCHQEQKGGEKRDLICIHNLSVTTGQYYINRWCLCLFFSLQSRQTFTFDACKKTSNLIHIYLTDTKLHRFIWQGGRRHRHSIQHRSDRYWVSARSLRITDLSWPVGVFRTYSKQMELPTWKLCMHSGTYTL